jgi:hypothetical protein
MEPGYVSNPKVVPMRRRLQLADRTGCNDIYWWASATYPISSAFFG